MAKVVVSIKLMPESPDVDLNQIQAQVEERIDTFAGTKDEKRFSIEPIAFGLKALKVMFVMDESIGSTDELEQQLGTIDGVQSVDVTDVRRAVG